jgi:putative transposase
VLFREDSAILPKIGRVSLARAGFIPTDAYKSASVKFKNGTWYVSVRKEIEDGAVDDTRPKIGIDVGVVNLITTSCGVSVKNPRTLKKHSRDLKRLQKSLSRKKKGSKNRLKAKKRLSRKHEKVSNIRKTNLHRISKTLTVSHSMIGIEDLRVQQMTRKGKKQRKKSLNRSIMDASFGELRRQLEYKGRRYGCKVIAVDPAYTSQTCNCCGFVSRQNRKTQSSFECIGCGNRDHADLNAAKNILQKAVIMDHMNTLNACGSGSKTVSVRKRRLEKKQEKPQ